MIKLHIEEDNNSPADDVMSLLKNIPDEDIDHHETDLYLRKTPEVTKTVINKLPDIYKKNVTTFRDQIDHDIWYEIPFVFPRGKVRKPTNESNNSKTLSLEFAGDIIDVPVSNKWSSGKHIWNIGNHNPYIDNGYVIICNTRDYKVIPETLEFVYVGKENAKALHKEAGKHEINDKNYKKYLVTDINIEESINVEDDIETWDVSFWDAVDEETYDLRTIHMTKNEVKNYVDKLNAKRSDYDKENGSFYDYVLA